MNKPFLSFNFCILFFILAFQTNAQVDCGTDFFHNRMMQTDSAYRNYYIDLDSKIKAIIQNQTSIQGTAFLTTSVYTIPVVVHVIHLGEAIGTGTNISDAQIQGAIQGLNDRWKNIIGNSLDMQFEFCLATRDPFGNSTTGINRVDGSLVLDYPVNGISIGGCGVGANENNIKVLSQWPVADYYNIWVVNNICNGQWSGWAYFPNGSPNDGTVIKSTSMINSSPILTHEVGHGFYLYHTFQDDGGNASCPPNSSCLDYGDKVCDTPPHKQSDCGVTNPCSTSGIWNNTLQNYMSYCSGRDRFTQGQKDRTRAAASVAPRVSLLTSFGCITPSADDAGIETVLYPVKTTYTKNCATTDSILPKVILRNYGTASLTSATINFQIDNNPFNSYSWSGSLTSGDTMEVTLPYITVTTGTHTFLAYTNYPNSLADGFTHNDSCDITFEFKHVPAFTLTGNVINESCNGVDSSVASVTINSITKIIEDWEGSSDWTIVNGSQNNRWMVGTSTSNGGIKSIYISNDTNTNSYNINSSSIVHFYKDFYFPPNATNITVKFDWMGVGIASDYVKVFLIPTTTIPSAGYNLTGGQIGSNTYSLQNVFTTATITGLDANAGKSMRLVFSWRNVISSGVQPPAAIDNIVISYDTPMSGIYTYLWYTIPPQTNSFVFNLSPGAYMVTVDELITTCHDSTIVTITGVNPQNNLPITQSNDTLTSPYSPSNYWYIVGNPTPVDSGVIHVCSQSGDYFVTGIDSNGCAAVSATLSVICYTSITNLASNLKKIRVYPNPTKGLINVVGSGIENGNYKCVLKSTLGEVIYQFEILIDNNFIQKTFSIEKFSNGIYFLEFEGEQTRTVLRINKI